MRRGVKQILVLVVTVPIILRFGCWENDLFGSMDGLIAEFLSSDKTSLGWILHEFWWLFNSNQQSSSAINDSCCILSNLLNTYSSMGGSDSQQIY